MFVILPVLKTIVIRPEKFDFSRLVSSSESFFRSTIAHPLLRPRLFYLMLGHLRRPSNGTTRHDFSGAIPHNEPTGTPDYNLGLSETIEMLSVFLREL
jgi:hypothetical protein